MRDRVPCRNALRHARQMIVKHSFTTTFVLYADVIDLVMANGVTDFAHAERRARRIWCDECFPLDIYQTAQGEEGTLAEFMHKWLKDGYRWRVSYAHLKTLSRTTKKRDLTRIFIENAMQRLRRGN